MTGLTTSKTSIFDAAPAAFHDVKLDDYFFACNTILWYYRFVVCFEPFHFRLGRNTGCY